MSLEPEQIQTQKRIRSAEAIRLEQFLAEASGRTLVVAEMLGLLEVEDAFSRLNWNPGHFTASAFVLSPDRSRVLLIHHKKLDLWLQPGGHFEPGDASLLDTAKREAVEETGVQGLELRVPGVFDVDIHDIPRRKDEGPHQHFDVRFAFVAESDQLTLNDEVHGARWVAFDGLDELACDESVNRPVAKLRRLG